MVFLHHAQRVQPLDSHKPTVTVRLILTRSQSVDRWFSGHNDHIEITKI
jgi:hypothetical protein